MGNNSSAHVVRSAILLFKIFIRIQELENTENPNCISFWKRQIIDAFIIWFQTDVEDFLYNYQN